MLKNIIMSLLAVGTVSSSFAMDLNDYSQPGYYLGGGLGVGVGGILNRDGSTDGGLIGFGALANFGYKFNPYVSMQGDVVGIFMGFSSLALYGLSGRFSLPVSERVSLYSKIGVGAITFVLDDFDSIGDKTATAFTPIIGIGVEGAINPNFSLGLDYTAAYKNSSGTKGMFGLLNLALTYHFN